jgi:hypothetical protein
MRTHLIQRRTWLAGLVLSCVLVFTSALQTSAADPLPDVACARGGSSCPFVGEFRALAIVSTTVSGPSVSGPSIYLPMSYR